jgi:hypothetical protein
MALRGTLKDFGIADILQLIGHQQKTGILTVKNKDSEVQIHFIDGTVVRAESSTRQKRDLLGRMLVRAEILSEEQLTRALETQKRTLKRLGQILVESGTVDKKSLKTFTKLQTSETIYRLFLWESGTYEFAQQDIQAEPDYEPIRSESVLMEGFRQVDEWPAIRKKLSGYGVTFDKVKDLDQMLAAMPVDEMSGLDDAFGEFDGSAPKSGGLKNIGSNERVVYQLITKERDVQKIIDLSRLGEFETCKALVSLIEAEIIRPAAEQPKRSPSAEATVGGISVKQRSPIVPVLSRVFVSLVLLAVAAVGVRALVPQLRGMSGDRAQYGYVDLAVQSELSLAQEQRLAAALGLYQTRFGKYPESLDELVQGGMLVGRDLQFPWQHPYHYAKVGDGFELVRPLY